MVLMQLEPITITASKTINTDLLLWCRSFDNDHVYGQRNANYGREKQKLSTFEGRNLKC